MRNNKDGSNPKVYRSDIEPRGRVVGSCAITVSPSQMRTDGRPDPNARPTNGGATSCGAIQTGGARIVVCLVLAVLLTGCPKRPVATVASAPAIAPPPRQLRLASPRRPRPLRQPGPTRPRRRGSAPAPAPAPPPPPAEFMPNARSGC
jgi:hypothetical protein